MIGLEDNRPVDAGLAELTRRCSANGVRLFVDTAVDDDIKRDRIWRAAWSPSKLTKFRHENRCAPYESCA